MKSGNYDELMNKFYAGKASAEEISILRSAGLPDDQDILYVDLLNSERDYKMEWDFEDLINEIPVTKVATLPGRRVQMKRMMAAAAIVATILIAYIFWPIPFNPKEIVNVPVINKQVDSIMDMSASAALPVDKAKDSVLLSEDVKTHPTKITNYTVKTRKQRPPKSKEAAKDKKETSTSARDFMVMVNGKPITDEADAIAIMRESLGMVSRDLTNTIDELKPIGRIKIKF